MYKVCLFANLSTELCDKKDQLSPSTSCTPGALAPVHLRMRWFIFSFICL